jgi:hypothetical protein
VTDCDKHSRLFDGGKITAVKGFIVHAPGVVFHAENEPD